MHFGYRQCESYTRRIARYEPKTVRRNVLEPIVLDTGKFDSIGINYLLHCICRAGDFLVEPRQPVAMAAHAGLELVAPGGEVGKRRGQFGEQPLGGGEGGFRLRHALVDAGALLDARLDLFLQLGVFGVELSAQGTPDLRDLQATPSRQTV